MERDERHGPPPHAMLRPEPLPVLQATPLPVRAQAALREAIFAGRLRPGEKLPELPLSRELGTSQAVVREALLALEHQGLVQREANRGTQVVNLTRAEVAQRLEVRLLLEGRACVEAAARLDARGWAGLRRQLAAIGREAAREDHHGAAQADLCFHRAIWAACGNAVLARTLEGVAVPLFAFVSILRARTGRMDDLAGMHAGLLDALRGGDPAGIEASLRAHVLAAYRPFLDGGAPDLGQLLRAVEGQR